MLALADDGNSGLLAPPPRASQPGLRRASSGALVNAGFFRTARGLRLATATTSATFFPHCGLGKAQAVEGCATTLRARSVAGESSSCMAYPLLTFS